MGKEGELWDDSALIKAFENAVSKYKIMHGMGVATEGESETIDREENLQVIEADNGTQEECTENSNHIDSTKEITYKIRDFPSLLQIEDNPASELSPANNVESLVIQDVNVLSINENHPAKTVSLGAHMVSSDDLKNQSGTTWYSDSQDEYNQLLSNYYNLEEKRQKIIQQLNQYNNWNYQSSFSNTCNSEEYKAPISQPYESIACCCPYGCQAWAVPCNLFPAPCSSGTCMDRSCSTSKAAEDGNSMSREDAGIVTTAMVAAERALSSLTNEASNDANASSNGGKEEFGLEKGQVAETTKHTTDLDVVLKAWYSAGFYTGKYLTEQSFGKGKNGQGL